MANRNISATVQIGATMSATVGAVFGRLGKQIDALGSSLAKIKKQSSEITRLQTAQGKLAEAKAKGSAAATARYTAQIEKLSKALSEAGVDTSRLTSEQARLASAIARSEARMSSMTRIGAGMSRIKTAASGVGTAFANVRGQVMGLTTKLTALGAVAGYGFKTQFLDAAAEYEKLQTMLLSQNSGDVGKAKQNFGWISKFSTDNALSIKDMTGAFIKMRNFGLNPMDGSMQAIIDQNAKMGGGIYEAEGIVMALGQAWTKTKLQQEEALQLMERGVPVWDLLSKVTGKSAKELMEMSSKGELGRDVIAKLIKEMGKNSAGAAAAQKKTWNGMMRSMSSYWERFTTTVMSAGLFDWMKSKVGGWLDILDKAAEDGSLQKWAQDTGKAIQNAFEEFEKFATKSWDAVKSVKDFVGGWKSLGIILGAVMLAPTIASLGSLAFAISTVVFEIGALIGPSIIAGLTTLVATMKALAVASWAAAGPWFIMAAGIAAVGYVIYKFKDDIMDLLDSAINPLLDALREIGAWVGNSKIGKLFGLDKYNLDGTPQAEKAPVNALVPFKTNEAMKTDLLRQIMPAENMPAAGATNNVKQEFNMQITAPSSDAKAIFGAVKSGIQSMKLYDTTGTLVPQ